MTGFSHDASTDRLSYTPKRTLEKGKHAVRISATDAGGMSATANFTFKVAAR